MFDFSDHHDLLEKIIFLCPHPPPAPRLLHILKYFFRKSMIQTVDCSSKVKLALICVKAFKIFTVDNVPNNLFMTKKL